METLLVCLLVGYGVWLAAYLCWEKHQAGKNPQSDATPAAPPQERQDIVGKSTFRIRPRTPDAAIPTPQAATWGANDTSDIFSLFICGINQYAAGGTAGSR